MAPQAQRMATAQPSDRHGTSRLRTSRHKSQPESKIMHVTDCECEQAGWCERHQCEKAEHWWKVCCRSPTMFQAWEKGRGPGQSKARQSSTTNRRERCICRGEVLGLEECRTCKGLVQLKVFTCAMHGECTLARQTEGAACCAVCSDYTPELSRGMTSRH